MVDNKTDVEPLFEVRILGDDGIWRMMAEYRDQEKARKDLDWYRNRDPGCMIDVFPSHVTHYSSMYKGERLYE